jgi:uncharacterized protein YjiK
MKRTFAFILCVSGLLGHCSRKEPVSLTPPTEVETLRPVAVVDLSANVPEPSGIVYYQKNHSLLVVSDARPDIYEIDFEGRVLRTIPTTSSDLEGITLSNSGDSLYVVEERNQLVTCYGQDGTRFFSFPVRVATLDNNALEGIALGRRNHLYVLNEKHPRLLLEFAGTTEVKRTEIVEVTDLSDICYDELEDVLWLVSDESRKVLKLSTDGRLLAEWPLPFDKGEGITFADGNMYIVNDADAQLYVFEKPR